MKLEGGWNQNREHLLAGIGHLATHSAEVLEAVPDGMDVGHSHEHDLTVGVVLCTHKRRVEHKSVFWKQASRTRAAQWAKLPCRADHSRTGTRYTLEISIPFSLRVLKCRMLIAMTITSMTTMLEDC